MPPSKLEAVMSDKCSWLLDRAEHLCRTRTDAEDLVQETFLRFTDKFPEDSALPSQWPCASWLLSTMTHCYYDQRRRRRVRERNAADPLLSPGVEESPDSVEQAPWDLISSQQLIEAIQQLSIPMRSAILLYLKGRRNREIARELGISSGAVAKRLYDGRLKLRRLLEGARSSAEGVC